MFIEEQFEDLIELGEKVDTKEERVALLDKAKAFLKKYRYWIGGVIAVVAIGTAVYTEKQQIQTALTVEKVVEKIVPKYITVAHEIGNTIILNKDQFYVIKDGEVVQNGVKYYKKAYGSEKGDIKRYYTELKEIKGK